MNIKQVFTFDFSNLRGDFFGGLTAGIVALPLALAFGDQTLMGPMAGLYGAIAIGILAAIFGGTATQISGPTAPMTVVSTAVIIGMINKSGADSLQEALPLIIGTFFLAGFIEMVFGIIKLGRYIRYIPYSVVSGFMSGIGVIIIITQLFPLLGYNPSNDEALVTQHLPHAEEQILEGILQEEEREGVLSGRITNEDIQETARRALLVQPHEVEEKARKLASRSASGTVGTLRNIMRPFQIPDGINWLNFLLGIITIAIIYGFKRITTMVPSSLVALIAVTIGAFFLINKGAVPIIGEVQSGLPPLHLNFFGSFFEWGTLGLMIEFALTLAALGAIDSLLTSVVADNITKTKHDSNQELIGQGIGNMGAALIGGLPGAGATMRTVINAKSGGKTRISGVIAGVFLLLVLLGLGPIVAYIPKAVLAGILITVGIGIIDYRGLRHLGTFSRSEAVVLLLTLVLTVFVDLLTAVAVGMVLSAFLFMVRISNVVERRSESAPLRSFAREVPWVDEGNIIDKYGDEVFIKHLDGPLFFGFVNRFRAMMDALPNIKVVIFRMDKVPYVDQSGLYAMEEVVMDLREKGIKVVYVDLHGQPLDMFKRISLVPSLVPKNYLFDDFQTCLGWLEKYLKGEIIALEEEDEINLSDLGEM